MSSSVRDAFDEPGLPDAVEQRRQALGREAAEGLGVEGDEGHAGRLQLLAVIGFGALDLGVVPAGGVGERALKQRDLAGVEAAFQKRAESGDVEADQVARLHGVLLHLVQIAGKDRGQRVLLSVDHAELERHEHVGEGDWRDVGAEGLPSLDVDLQLRHAQLHALEVFGRENPARGGREIARSAVPGLHQAHPRALAHDGAQLVADRPVPDPLQMGVVAPEEVHLEDAVLRRVPAEDRQAGHDHVGAAEAQALHQLALVPKLPARIEAHLQVPAGFGPHLLGESNRGAVEQFRGPRRVGQAYDFGAVSPAAAAARETQRQRGNCTQK